MEKNTEQDKKQDNEQVKKVSKGILKVIWSIVKGYVRIAVKVGLSLGLGSVGDSLGADRMGAKGNNEIRRSIKEVKATIKQAKTGEDSGELEEVKKEYQDDEERVADAYSFDNPEFVEKYQYYYEKKEH